MVITLANIVIFIALVGAAGLGIAAYVAKHKARREAEHQRKPNAAS
jgi:hypothetical protein